MKKLIRILFYSGLTLLLVLAICDTIIESSSVGVVYTNVEKVPAKRTALVLGTSLKTRNGHMNPYFYNRMSAVVALYKAGKVKYIIVSGDNSRVGYDESTDMKTMLVNLGVPEEVIYLDYAGFRTLDSVVRCKEVFGQKDIVIVSQAFHNQRALFLSQRKGVSAVGYSATDVNRRYGFAVHVREKLARVKAVVDIVFGVKPKFFGPKIEVGNA